MKRKWRDEGSPVSQKLENSNGNKAQNLDAENRKNQLEPASIWGHI